MNVMPQRAKKMKKLVNQVATFQALLPEYESLDEIDQSIPSIFGKEHDDILRAREKLTKFVESWVRSAERELNK